MSENSRLAVTIPLLCLGLAAIQVAMTERVLVRQRPGGCTVYLAAAQLVIEGCGFSQHARSGAEVSQLGR